MVGPFRVLVVSAVLITLQLYQLPGSKPRQEGSPEDATLRDLFLGPDPLFLFDPLGWVGQGQG